MLEQTTKIINTLGLHARASAKLVSTAAKFSSAIEIEFGGKTADAKSIMSVMMLAASNGSELNLRTQGKDEQAAMEAITSLINNYFDEEQ